MSHRAKRCREGFVAGKCPLRNCEHFDGNPKLVKTGKPPTLRCTRCKSRMPREDLDARGMCSKGCESPTGHTGQNRGKHDALAAFEKVS